MKKGFTLIELLATILILLIVVVVSTPSVIKMIDNAKGVTKDAVEQRLYDAAKEYSTSYNRNVLNSLTNIGDIRYVNSEVLKRLGLVEQEDIDVLEQANVYVAISLASGNVINYDLIYDQSVVTLPEPFIIILGDNPLYIASGSTYTDPGAVAIDADGNNITSSIVVSGDTVNASLEGDYTVRYNVTDKNGAIATEATRIVSVVDFSLPEVASTTMTTNNPLNNQYAKNGDIVTIAITFSKNISNTPTVTIGGRAATVTGSGTTRTATYTVPAGEATLTEGLLGVQVNNYLDSFGNSGSSTITGQITYDRTMPVYVSFNILLTATNASTAFMTISFTGASQMCITEAASCTAWEAYATSKTFTLSAGNGVKTINIWARDIAGNVTAKYSDTIIRDIEVPICTVTGGSPIWYNTDRTITGTCSDTGGSGCMPNISYTYTVNTNITTGGPGSGGAAGTISDLAGNTATCAATQTVKIDKTVPTCSVAGGNASWTTGSRTITGTCGDTGGSNCSVASIAYTFSTNTNTTAAGPGAGGAAGAVTDVAGNSVSCPANQIVKIDTTAPSATASLGTQGSSSYVINAGGSDAESGIVYYAFSNDNGASFTANQAGWQYNFTGLATGTTYNFKVRTTNGSGLTTVSAAVAGTTKTYYLTNFSFASWYRYASPYYQSTSSMQAGRCYDYCTTCCSTASNGHLATNYTYVYPTAAMISALNGAEIASMNFYITRLSGYGGAGARTLDIYAHTQTSGTSSLQSNEYLQSIALVAGTSGWTPNVASGQTFANNLVSGARKGWVFKCDVLSNYQGIGTDTLIQVGYYK